MPDAMAAGALSDQALLQRVRDGNHDAFRLLVERYEDQVAATIIGMLGPGPEADDAGQETFVRLYERIDQFRGDSTLRTYLTRIAINQALQALRKRNRWTRRFLSRDRDGPAAPDPAADARDDVETAEEKQLVHRALQELPDHYRAVVVLRLLQGYSTRETAAILDVAEGTVMSRLYRATNKLQALLAPLLRPEHTST